MARSQWVRFLAVVYYSTAQVLPLHGDREPMEEQNGYVIDSQGKAPEFVLEVASPTIGTADYTDKRADYERFGVTEYWALRPQWL